MARCWLIGVVAIFVWGGNPLGAEEYRIARVEVGQYLSYRIISVRGSDAFLKQLAEDDDWALEAWKRSGFRGDTPIKHDVIFLKETFSDWETADVARQAKIYENAFFSCWCCAGEKEVCKKCNPFKDRVTRVPRERTIYFSGKRMGSKTVKWEQQVREKRVKCRVCQGYTRLKARGFVILKMNIGDRWSYHLIRKEYKKYFERQIEIRNQEVQLGNSDQDPIRIRPVKGFGPLEEIAAREEYVRLMVGARSKKGFDTSVRFEQMPPIDLAPDMFASRS